MQLPVPENEVARLENLRSYGILDTPPEQAFDDLTRLAAYICGTPIALMGFMDVDRHWFKSRIGWDIAEVPREMSFCSYTILQSDVLVVSDTLEDAKRLGTCPLATHGGIRFYAGVPLISAEGYALGTLCVMDSVPRGLTAGQIEALLKLTRQAMTQLESRRRSIAPTPSPAGSLKVTEIKGAERVSDALYLAITNTASDAIILIDEDSKILFVNSAAERIFGYGKNELLGQQLTILMPDHLQHIHRQSIKKYVETGKRHLAWGGVELPGLNKSGREVRLEVSFGESVHDGKRIFAGICRDITERRQLEHERRQLAAIVDSSQDAIIGKDLEGIITSWNKGAERIYGYPAEEVLGKPSSILVPEEYRHQTVQIMQRLGRGENAESCETVRTTRNGELIPISLTVSPIRDDTGRIVGASAIERNISESKRAQQALHDGQQRLESIISSAMDAIITVDSAQRILVFNKAAEQIFGCTASEALGQSIDKFIPQRFREKHQQHIQNFGRTGVTGRSMYSPGTLFALRADGQEFPIEATISHVEAGSEKLFTVILRDISARAHMEEELRQAQKIEALGQLAGGIAHEFNNFLGVILGYGELLSEEAGDNESLRRKVAEIKAATQRAASLTRQLLAFSRKQLLEPKVLDLNQVIWETHKLLRRLVPANIDIVPVLTPTIGQVKADPGQLQQILINLVMNARDAMPAKGGKVIIETTSLELDEEHSSQPVGLRAGGYAMLSISDTGSGMTAETRGRIFEPFFTTKQPGKGTGLGLSTIYGVVKQSGGQITVESDVGKGTIFRIYLPLAQQEIEGAPVTAADTSEQRGTETILVVEDETALRRLLSMSLERRGYKVFAAKDGAEASELFCQHQDQIHLVVCDIMMPHVDGFELKQRLAALRPDVKFLFMSGYSEEILEKHKTLLQSSAFLEKPFLPDELADKVRDLLRGEVAA